MPHFWQPVPFTFFHEAFSGESLTDSPFLFTLCSGIMPIVQTKRSDVSKHLAHCLAHSISQMGATNITLILFYFLTPWYRASRIAGTQCWVDGMPILR